MIKRKQRLKPTVEFLKDSQKKEKGGVKIYFKNNNLKFSRFVVSVPNKIYPKAVERNKIKRQIKTIFKNWEKNRKDIKLNYDILVMVVKKLPMRFQSLKNRLTMLLEDLK